jgi:hypothetical protein
VIDGTEFLEKPWQALEKIQDFLNIKKMITRKNFVLSKDGLQCFREHAKDTGNISQSPFYHFKIKEHWCVGGDKGRTLDKKFDMDVGFALDTLFGPMDRHFAEKILRREKFNWNFGSSI